MKRVLGLIRCFNEKPPEEIKETKQQRLLELPEEIIVEILLRLPFKSVIQLSCVSKKWRSLILYDLQFSKSHYKVASQQRTLGQSLLISIKVELPSRHSAYKLSNPKFQFLDVLAGDQHVPNFFLSSSFKESILGPFWFSDIQLLGSCNGLVCLSIGCSLARRQYFKNVHIWNPSTGFVRNLLGSMPGRLLRNLFSGSPHMSLDRFDLATSGFGYVNATDDYKYVVLASPEALFPLKKGLRAEIFSLRTKCWKRIDLPSNTCYNNHSCNTQRGIYLHEALHWITVDEVENKTTITAFDLGSEEFRQMPLPPDSMNTYCPARRNAMEVLVRLGDCICLWRSNSHDIQFLVMREYNVHESWNLLYSFRTTDMPAYVAHRKLLPVFVTESGTFMLSVCAYWNLSLIRIECHKDKKPVCSDQHIFEKINTAFWYSDAIQYDQTLLSAS